MNNLRDKKLRLLINLCRSYLNKDWIKMKDVIRTVLYNLETNGYISKVEFRSITGLLNKEKRFAGLSPNELMKEFDELFIPPEPETAPSLLEFLT